MFTIGEGKTLELVVRTKIISISSIYLNFILKFFRESHRVFGKNSYGVLTKEFCHSINYRI